jgi:hypothetical protein
MPSAEASAIDLGDEFSFKFQKPKKVGAKSEKQLIADVLKKSIKMKHQDDKAFEEAKSLFKAKSQSINQVKPAKKQDIAPKVLAKKKTEEEIDKENG